MSKVTPWVSLGVAYQGLRLPARCSLTSLSSFGTFL